MMNRIHIVSCGPRTGTTLLFEMMVACFDIDLYNRHEDRIYSWPKGHGRVFLTKTPRDILVIKSFLRAMPDLYVIYMLRDPRDTVVSKHGNDPERYWSSLRYWKTYAPYGHELRGHPRFITIRYEDLVTNPDDVQYYLEERIPFLVRRAPFSRYHELAHPSNASIKALGDVRPVRPYTVGNWHNHKPRLKGQIIRHGSISEDLIRYGYEKDMEWEKELDGIEPDMSPSHWPEDFSTWDLLKRKGLINLKVLWGLMGQYPIFWSSRKFLAKLLRG